MEAVDRGIERWLRRHAPAHLVGSVRRLRDEADPRMGRLERRVEEIAAASATAPPAMSVPVAPPPRSKAMAAAAVPMDVMPPYKGMALPPMEGKGMDTKAGVMSMDVEYDDEGMVGGGVKVPKEKVKEMVMSGTGSWEVVGISGMGGSGKTTLAMEIFRDQKVQAYFSDR